MTKTKIQHKWTLSSWWFRIFFMFTPIWGRFPFWLLFFRWVETTNQINDSNKTRHGIRIFVGQWLQKSWRKKIGLILGECLPFVFLEVFMYKRWWWYLPSLLGSRNLTKTSSNSRETTYNSWEKWSIRFKWHWYYTVDGSEILHRCFLTTS